MNIKHIGKSFICLILESQAKRLRQKHSFIVVAVAGSIGKTSTKLAIAHTLEPTRRVIYQTGNYNDRLTVPLVLFGQKLPGLFNGIAWARIFWTNERTIKRPFFYDFAVLELGTDHPGEMKKFVYLQPDISVVTAITPEHMEYFKTLDAVATEELLVAGYSKQVLINADDTPAQYLKGHTLHTYGLGSSATFQAQNVVSKGLHGSSANLVLEDTTVIPAEIPIMGDQGIKITLAAAAAAHLGGLTPVEIGKGLHEIRPFAGRMQMLVGKNNSVIIDDSYNASPAAVIAALKVLYEADALQRIAILGNMNELGEYSRQAHEEVGAFCDPAKLDLVVTIGVDAQKYLASTAESNGCQVASFDSPYAAGKYVEQYSKPGAIILVEGSQNGVFAEEAIKSLLADKAEESKLVRQSKYWMDIKAVQFNDSNVAN